MAIYYDKREKHFKVSVYSYRFKKYFFIINCKDLKKAKEFEYITKILFDREYYGNKIQKQSDVLCCKIILEKILKKDNLKLYFSIFLCINTDDESILNLVNKIHKHYKDKINDFYSTINI